MRNLWEVLRMLRIENERLMACGYGHMSVSEIRFVLGGIDPRYRAQFDALAREIAP